MSAAKSLHVAPTPAGWAVRQTGAERALRVFKSLTAAVGFARQAVRVSGEFYVHAADGSVKEKVTVRG